MPRPTRITREIKTLSGRVDRIANPYLAYMQITCLEMQKARKGLEKASALERVRTIDARLQEIDVEKASLLRALGEREAVAAPVVHDLNKRRGANKTGAGLRVCY